MRSVKPSLFIIFFVAFLELLISKALFAQEEKLIALNVKTSSQKVKILPSKEKGEHIPGIQWKEKEAPLQLDDNQKPFIEVRLSFAWDERELIYNEDVLEKPTKEDSILIRIPITGKVFSTQITAVGPTGDVEIEKVTIEYLDYDNVFLKKPDKLGKKNEANSNGIDLQKNHLGFQVATTLVQYQETELTDFNQTTLTIRSDYTYKVAPSNSPWSATANAYFSLLPLIQTPKQASSIRFFSSNLRIEYEFLNLNTPWFFKLTGGLYYTTTFVAQNQFGFKHMRGPQILPIAGYKLSESENIQGYFKFSPISSGLIPSIVSRELATGILFQKQLNSKLKYSFNLDYTKTHVNFENIIFINAQAFSLGAGLIF